MIKQHNFKVFVVFIAIVAPHGMSYESLPSLGVHIPFFSIEITKLYALMQCDVHRLPSN